MSTFAELAWVQIWQISVVALVAGGLAAMTCRRRPHLAYLLWLVVLAKCLTPPLWSSPTGLFSWALTTRAAAAHDSPATDARHDQPIAPATSPTAVVSAELRVVSISGLAPARSIAWPTALAVICVCWLGGALALGLGLVIKLRRVTARLERTALPLQAAWLEQLNECTRRLGLRRQVRLLVTAEPIGPAVYGLFRPTIVLPDCVACRPPAALAPILSHELLHIRRGDPFVAAFQAVAQCVWWFHPLVWWANRQANRERERACDEEVLAELQVDPAAYGQCLLDILGLKQKLRPVLTFPGVRAREVTTRRLQHIMQLDAAFQSRTPGRYWALTILAAAAALPGAGLAFDSSPRPKAAPQSSAPASRAAEPGAHAKPSPGEPNFIVIPIRTELQRELVANGKPVDAVVELNGYALAGKQGDDLLRAIDAAAVRKALAAVEASSGKSSSSTSNTRSGSSTSSTSSQASLIFVAAYFGDPPSAIRELAERSGQKTLEQACRALAKEAGLRVERFYSTWDNTREPDRWKTAVAMLEGIDLARETAAESPVGDRDFSAFAARTQVTRLLTSSITNGRFVCADCVLYLRKPLDASDHPMVSADLAARIKQAVSKLDLSGHDRVDYHLILADHDRQAYLRNRQAIMDRFYPNEAPQLTKQLGFKNYSVTQ
jgi:beta-lactamase regulating signal transducer with metallopeptidase domain